MSDLKDLQKRIADLIDNRDWRQFHDDPKGTLLALGGEVGELMEIFRFTSTQEAHERLVDRHDDIEDELGDILCNLLIFCEEYGFDLEKAFLQKQAKIEAKYSVTKARGVNAKYDRL